MTSLQPATTSEASAAIRAARRIQIHGASSKSGLAPAHTPPPDLILDSRSLTGVVEYEPTEYTITARAGTPLADLGKILAEQGQYLPFDPPFVGHQATLGGAVASGLSGPGRLRYGGLRDFILGIRFVDGEGKEIRGGGKVVKNSAGFDLPKLFVGSCGWLGLLTEVTMKVFPLSTASCTVGFEQQSLPQLTEAIHCLTTQPFELDALEFVPDATTRTRGSLLVRLAGERSALEAHREKLAAALSTPSQLLSAEEEGQHWRSLADAAWCGAGELLIKIPLTPRHLETLLPWCVDQQVDYRLGVAGQVLWVAWPSQRSLVDLVDRLNSHGLSGLIVRRGSEVTLPAGQGCRLGKINGHRLWESVKRAFDPENKFGDWQR